MTTPNRRPRHVSRRAFNLVEVIATIVIIGMLGAISAGVLRTAVDGYADAATRAELVNAASATLERMVTTLRDVPLRAAVTPAEPAITTITTDSITMHNGDGLARVGAELQLIIAGVASSLTGDVSDFQIRAFDQDNAAMALSLSGDACDPVRRLELTLTLSRNGVSETLRTRVFLRCMMRGAAP